MEKTSIIKISPWRGPNPQGVLTPSGNPTAWARGIRNEIRDIIPGIRFRWDRDCKFDVRVAGYAMTTPEDADRVVYKLGILIDVIYDSDKYHPNIMKWIGVTPPEVISLRIPASLKAMLESQAKARGLSLNSHIKNILKEATK